MYHFKVMVADMVGHTCTSDVFIKVVDVNDNRPLFEQEEYFATVRENATSSVVLTQVIPLCPVSPCNLEKSCQIPYRG